MPPALFFLLRIVLALWALGSIQSLRCFFPSSVKRVIGILMRIVLNLLIAFGSVVIFTILFLPIHEHGMYFHLFVSSVISFNSVLSFPCRGVLPPCLDIFLSILFHFLQLF